MHLFLEGGRDLTPTYRCEIPPSLKGKHNIFSSLDGCSCTITLGTFFEGALQKERIKICVAAFLGSTQIFLTLALHFLLVSYVA